MATPRTAPTSTGVNFGSDEMYVAGGGLPEGTYVLYFDVRNHQAMNRQNVPVGAARLGVMLTAYPLVNGVADVASDPKTKFLSMGGQADKSFAPDPDSAVDGLCKKLVAIPNAAGSTLPDSTNWNIFRKSLLDCGLPVGVFTDDVSVLDGIWAHTQNIPEPEERKGFGNKAQTGEVQADDRRQNQTVPVVTEILDGGKPWEGGGGIPEAKAAPAPKAGPRAVPVKPGPKAAPAPGRPAPAAATVPAAGVDTAEVEIAAINGITDVLAKDENQNGMAKLQLRIQTFKAVTAKLGEEVANGVISTYFGTDATLNGLLGQLGYTINGPKVVVAG